MSDILLWEGPKGAGIPNNADNAEVIISYAKNLTIKQQEQIIAAFQFEAYDMAAEYAWKKAMVKLKETISTLGMKFISEMLGREDIDEYSTIDTVLTDYSTIQLAEQLGVINNTAALKLRQANELISHYFSKDSTEQFDKISAIQIIKSSVDFILGEENISIAIEFSKFRERLLNEDLSIKDSQVEQVVNSALFYIRTVLSILLSSIKNDQGAQLEHAINNLNILITSIWKKLSENDRWKIGTAYRDVTSAGKTSAAVGLKNALLKIAGFDYVPENLRSVTFKKAATAVIETHFAYNNFYNEPAVVRKLANLGTTIPEAAFAETIQAYLAVCLGNRYGVSINAASIAKLKLEELSPDKWHAYFERLIHFDEVVLLKMGYTDCVERFSDLLINYSINSFKDLPKDNQELYEAIIKKNYYKARRLGETLYNRIKKAH